MKKTNKKWRSFASAKLQAKSSRLLAIIAIAAVILFACGNGDCTHTWEWEVTTAPAEFKDGVKTETCSKCSETRNTEAILASGLVQIPGGSFTMGPDIWNNDAEFNVTLSAFKMSKYAVTQDLYQAVMGNNPSYFNGGPTGGVDDYYLREPAEGETQGRRPVEMVNWYDAIIFCNKLSVREGLSPVYKINGSVNPSEWGEVPYYNYSNDIIVGDTNKWDAVEIASGSNGYRLPTDVQWEYACRAGTSTKWHFGDDESKLEEYAWYGWEDKWGYENPNGKTHQVGLLKPNQWGLYDMYGNVIEWCWDWWGDYPAAAKTDYTGAETGTDRVKRGGSWIHSAEYTRSASRLYSPPVWSDVSGFRVVRP